MASSNRVKSSQESSFCLQMDLVSFTVAFSVDKTTIVTDELPTVISLGKEARIRRNQQEILYAQSLERFAEVLMSGPKVYAQFMLMILTCGKMFLPIFKLPLVIAPVFWLAPQLLAVSIRSTGSGEIIDVGYAKYRGNRSFENTVAYLGIPYSEPPLGDRRFRAPLPLNTTRIAQETASQIVDATQYPEFCVQGSTGGSTACKSK
ncbi:hypothetical protein F5050DRAFT_1715655 [Lentinula boryana]|uniref:Carboxylesterase type B domain-containing protein n=1 Tax=Lentinula boryana TaxID=40481 RepID=A0ABQ8Q2N0_9AGAR|nr:hypothetical protein F5050DRAFT_1715655 [Lentinula boryana]